MFFLFFATVNKMVAGSTGAISFQFQIVQKDKNILILRILKTSVVHV